MGPPLVRGVLFKSSRKMGREHFAVPPEELPSSRYWMGFSVKDHFRQVERVGWRKEQVEVL